MELRPDEEYDLNGVRIYGELQDGESHTFAQLDGWKIREFDLEIDVRGGHIDFLEYTREAPSIENELVLAAIAHVAREKSRQMLDEPIISVEDPEGNLL